jgi:hypothetical protein
MSECEHRSASFDRTLCACGAMHEYCDDCGMALGCSLDESMDSTWPQLLASGAVVPVPPAGAAVGAAHAKAGTDAGRKDDTGKPRMELLPPDALTEVAAVMTFGAAKYGDYNWNGLSASRLFGAALRHLWAWWGGEDNDPETGRPHLAHAACCALMVLEQARHRPEYDDRP